MLALLLCGCSPSSYRSPFSQEIVDKANANRLLLEYTQSGLIRFGSPKYEFDSLSWQTNNGSEWVNRVVLTRAEFQGIGHRDRWINGIYGINPTNSIAIIRVAEADAPANSRIIHYVYSWREWNLVTNGEVRLLRSCANPFETYQKGASQ
jgi:hypothetical protein